MDIEQNNGTENENDEKMKVVEKDEITSDHKDNDMRNVEDGDNKMQKFMNNKKKGIRYFFILYLYTLVYSSQTFFFMILEIFICY